MLANLVKSPVFNNTPPPSSPPVSDKNEYKATKLALCILGSFITAVTAGLYVGYCLIKYTVIKPNIATALALVTILAIGVIAFAIFSKHAFKTPPIVSPVSRKNSDALPKALKKKASPAISPPSDSEISSNGVTNKIPPVAPTTCSSNLSSPKKLQIQIPTVTDKASENFDKQLTDIELLEEENATTNKNLEPLGVKDLGTITKEPTQLSPNVKIPVDSPKDLLQMPEVFTVSSSASDADASSTTDPLTQTEGTSSGPSTDSSEAHKTKEKRKKKKKKKPSLKHHRTGETSSGQKPQKGPNKIQGASSGKKSPARVEKLD